MDGLIINGVDFLETYGYDIETITIRTAPAPKTKYIDITGMDGSLDYTEQDGRIRYKSGVMVVNLSKQADMETHYQDLAAIKQLCHGKKCTIIIPYDPDCYLRGRISVKESCDNFWSAAELTITYDPYHYKIRPTVRKKQISGTVTLICANAGMNTIPTINCSNAMTAEFEGTVYHMDAGNNRVNDIIFNAGKNQIIFKGSGTVTVTYEEGWL